MSVLGLGEEVYSQLHGVGLSAGCHGRRSAVQWQSRVFTMVTMVAHTEVTVMVGMRICTSCVEELVQAGLSVLTAS